MSESKVLALIAPGNIREVGTVIYSIEEGLSKHWDLFVEPWDCDANNWIAVYGTPKGETS